MSRGSAVLAGVILITALGVGGPAAARSPGHSGRALMGPIRRGRGPRALVLAMVIGLITAMLPVPVGAAEPALDTSLSGTMAEADLSSEGDGLAKLTIGNPHHFWVAVDLEPRAGNGLELRMANPVSEDLGGVWAGGGLIPPEGTAAWMVEYDPAGSGSQTVRIHYDLSAGGLMAMVGNILQIVADGLGGGLAKQAPEKVDAAIHALAASPVVIQLIRDAQQGANPLSDIVPLTKELLGTATGREVLKQALTDAGLTGVTTGRLAKLGTAVGVLDGAVLVADLLASVLQAHTIGEVTVSIAQPRAHWMAPTADTEVSSPLDLAVWPEPDVQVASVAFRATWPDGSADLCTTTSVSGDGLWRCAADLAKLGVPGGVLDLSFSLESPSGEVSEDAGGPWQVTYGAADDRPDVDLTDPEAYLLAGIPESARPCRTRTENLIPAMIAAVNCHPRDPLIKEMAYYLMRPADAQATFDERMAEHGATGNGDCRRGRTGTDQRTADLSSGCYVDPDGRANLRFSTSTACPAAYWAVLGTNGALGKLTAAYDRMEAAWSDPGNPTGEEPDWCSGRLPPSGPPGTPPDARAAARIPASLQDDVVAGCRAKGYELGDEPGSCRVTLFTWGRSRGRVDSYRIEDRQSCERWNRKGKLIAPDVSIEVIGRVPSTSPRRYLLVTQAEGVSVCSHDYRVVAVNSAGRSDPADIVWPRSPDPEPPKPPFLRIVQDGRTYRYDDIRCHLFGGSISVSSGELNGPGDWAYVYITPAHDGTDRLIAPIVNWQRRGVVHGSDALTQGTAYVDEGGYHGNFNARFLQLKSSARGEFLCP